MALSEYRKKRDFDKTTEPRAAKKSKRSSKDPIFVIQKHQASHLHYDFRLEAGGVLLSWAVPKGPSTDPKEKRLAVMTEDHPLDYADFEGVIPEDEYGGGTVMVWDKGTYKNTSEKDGKDISISQAKKKGHISVRLNGKKLKGGYSLVRFKGEKNWLLIKEDDHYADARRNPTSTQNKSAKTGRSMAEITQNRQ